MQKVVTKVVEQVAAKECQEIGRVPTVGQAASHPSVSVFCVVQPNPEIWTMVLHEDRLPQEEILQRGGDLQKEGDHHPISLRKLQSLMSPG